MFKSFKKYISLDNPLRLFYHKIRAVIANIMYGFPSKNMVVVGVTGTNGKTTTCNIIAKGLRKTGKKVFMFSTVNIILNDNEYTNTTKMTSPDVFELQRLLQIAKKEGCEIAIIETASHGIKMHRIWGIPYDIVILTNISQDHLDLHHTMEDYVNTKLEIFKNLIMYARKPNIKKTAVINMDSEYANLFLAETYDSLLTYGNSYKANIRLANIHSELTGAHFDVTIAGKNLNITTKLIGNFNVENICAAIGVFITFGISFEDIQNIIKDISGVPGRMDEVENTQGYKIFIDYAHTPDALEKILENLRSVRNIKKIITVFGATGDRDRTKRPVMGEIISRLSDVFILTQDDDYSEKTEDIIKDVLTGINREEGENFWIISTRTEAIRTALMMAEKDDIILIAGKGDEHTMMTNNGPIPWHDKAIVQSLLKEIDENQIIE